MILGGSQMSKELSVNAVVIANISEFYQPVFCHFPEGEIAAWIEPSRAESDMALFWCGDNKLVITSDPLDPQFVSDVRHWLNYRNVHLASPAKTSPSLCTDIVEDGDLFALLVNTLRNSANPQIVTWGATGQFYVLVERLRQKGVQFTTPEVPEPQNYWTVIYLDSKSGFRDFHTSLSRQEPSVRLPRGFICADIEVAVRVAESLAEEDLGLVIKADNSVGGYGVLLYPPGREKEAIGMNIRMNARLFPILSAGPVVVEEFIQGAKGADGASPSIQALVVKPGNARVRCLANQMLGSGGKYVGAILGPDVLSAALRVRLNEIGQAIGNAISALGYRGVFNVDTVLGADGQVYCVELNARRTSVTYALDIAEHLFGPNCLESMTFITHDRFASPNLARYSYSNVRSLLSTLLFPMNGEPEGVLITIPSSLRHFARRPLLGFMAFSENMSTTRAIHSKVCALLGAGERGQYE